MKLPTLNDAEMMVHWNRFGLAHRRPTQSEVNFAQAIFKAGAQTERNKTTFELETFLKRMDDV